MNGQEDNKKRRRRLVLVIVILLAIIAALMPLFCNKQKEEKKKVAEDKELVLIPRHLAVRFDVDGILDYCQNKIAHEDYDGMMRGAHGALWAGRANEIDRVMLAAAAMEAEGLEVLVDAGSKTALPRVAFSQDGKWRIITFDSSAPQTQPAASQSLKFTSTTSDSPPLGAIKPQEFAAKHPELVHKITAKLLLNGRLDSEIKGPAVPLADLVCWSAMLDCKNIGGDKNGYVLKLGDRVLLESGPLDKIDSAELELVYEFGKTSEKFTRELFDKQNGKAENPGLNKPRVGDRFAIAFAGGNLVYEALKARSFMLESDRDTPVADPIDRDLILLANRYIVQSDVSTEKLATDLGVKTTWHSPRIVIASAMGQDDPKADSPIRYLGLDVQSDRVDAEGKYSRQFNVVRSMSCDQLESKLVYDIGKKAVISASNVLNHYASTMLNSGGDRASAVEEQAAWLLEHGIEGMELLLWADTSKSAMTAERFLYHETPPATAATSPAGKPDIKIQLTDAGLFILGAAEKKGEGGKGNEYVLDPAGKVYFGSNLRPLVWAVEDILGRCVAKCDDYVLRMQLVRNGQLGEFPVQDGSMLTYRVKVGDKESKLLVIVDFEKGVPFGHWADMEGKRFGAVEGRWPAALSVKDGLPVLGCFAAQSYAAEGKPADFQYSIGGRQHTVKAVAVDFKDGDARGTGVLLPFGSKAIVLAWRKGESSLELESISQAVTGCVVDQSDRPVRGAAITLTDGRGRTQSACDGTFVMPVSQVLFKRLIIVVDRSGSMAFGLSPSARSAAKSGEVRRIDVLRKAVHELLGKVPQGTQVALWSFSTPKTTGRSYPDFADPNYTRVDVSFTTDLAKVGKAIDEIEPEEGTPLTGAVIKVLDYIVNDPASRDAVIVMLTDGENSCKSTSAAAAYKNHKGQVPIHTIGFAIAPGGKAELELKDLAKTSGGTYNRAETSNQLVNIFRGVGADLSATDMRIVAQGCEPYETKLSADVLAGTPMTVQISRNGTPGLLQIYKKNVKDLDLCQELSPKARRMIEARVADGKWSVIIPRRRTNIGQISAYGWFEREIATGRMIGRTEDGLHGALEEYVVWPAAKAAGGDLPMVAEVIGITAYTVGCVKAGLTWRKDMDYGFASELDLARYIRANALEFCASWMAEVGSNIMNEEAVSVYYWAGVKLNYDLQRLTLNVGWDEQQFADTILKDLLRRLEGMVRDLPANVLQAGIASRFGGDFLQFMSDSITLYNLDISPADKTIIDIANSVLTDDAKKVVNETVWKIVGI